MDESVHFIDEKAVAQSGEVICLRSHSKVTEERAPALCTDCPLPTGLEACICASLRWQNGGGGSGETDKQTPDRQTP